MKRDGTHQMTLVTNTVKGVKVHTLTCNDCNLQSNPLKGDEGKDTLVARMGAHQTSTRTQAEVKRRNGG